MIKVKTAAEENAVIVPKFCEGPTRSTSTPGSPGFLRFATIATYLGVQRCHETAFSIGGGTDTRLEVLRLGYSCGNWPMNNISNVSFFAYCCPYVQWPHRLEGGDSSLQPQVQQKPLAINLFNLEGSKGRGNDALL